MTLARDAGGTIISKSSPSLVTDALNAVFGFVVVVGTGCAAVAAIALL